MINIKLFTRIGELIHEELIPVFAVPPEVVYWNNRVYVHPSPENLHCVIEFKNGEDVYIEAVAYLCDGGGLTLLQA